VSYGKLEARGIPVGVLAKAQRAGVSFERAPRRRVATTRPARGRRGRPARKPCKYGPRGPDGLCPKKPRPTFGERVAAKTVGIRATSRGRATVATRIERALTSRATTAAAAYAISRGRTAKTGARRAIARLAGPGGKGTIAAGLAAIGRKGVTTLPKKFVGGAVIGAFITSYLTTTGLLKRWKSRRLEKQQLAAEAADAYRAARLGLAAEQGQPLSPEQHRLLADAFKTQLADIGVPSGWVKIPRLEF